MHFCGQVIVVIVVGISLIVNLAFFPLGHNANCYKLTSRCVLFFFSYIVSIWSFGVGLSWFFVTTSVVGFNPLLATAGSSGAVSRAKVVKSCKYGKMLSEVGVGVGVGGEVGKWENGKPM